MRGCVVLYRVAMRRALLMLAFSVGASGTRCIRTRSSRRILSTVLRRRRSR